MAGAIFSSGEIFVDKEIAVAELFAVNERGVLGESFALLDGKDENALLFLFLNFGGWQVVGKRNRLVSTTVRLGGSRRGGLLSLTTLWWWVVEGSSWGTTACDVGCVPNLKKSNEFGLFLLPAAGKFALFFILITNSFAHSLASLIELGDFTNSFLLTRAMSALFRHWMRIVDVIAFWRMQIHECK